MKHLLRCTMLVAVLAFTAVGEAKAEGTAVLGVVTCTKSGPGTTYVVYSRIPVTCTYDGAGGTQKYTGTRGILVGLDLEIEQSSVLGYLVVGGSWKDKNSLAGSYVGVQASATLGAGPTIQGGLGGGGNDISLVPVGLGGQLGVGFTAGVSYLTIEGAQ
ncbi:MAG: DUF992 domain-containing protein [Rhodospirillaceae bacterium]